jgi:hypothetical protein
LFQLEKPGQIFAEFGMEIMQLRATRNPYAQAREAEATPASLNIESRIGAE